MTYQSGTFKTPTVRPDVSPPALGVLADPTIPKSIVGIAYPTCHVGGVKLGGDPGDDYAPPELVWRLEIDRAWVGGRVVALASREVLDGRFVLRSGRFAELAEGAD